MEDVKHVIKNTMVQLAADQSKQIGTINDNDNIVEKLGFTSIEVATLISMLDTTFNVDPFGTGEASVTEVGTVGQLTKVYERCLKNKEKIE